MRKKLRHEAILEQIHNAGAHRVLSTRELAHYFDVSEMTIRRDLKELSAAGLIQRQHGGATLLRRPPPTKHHDQIGIFLVSRHEKYTDPFFNEVLQGADRKIRELGYRTAYVLTYADVPTGNQVRDLLRRYRADGILLIGTQHAESIEHLMKAAPVLVAVNGSLGPEYDAILLDGCTGIRQVVDHLAKLGRKRLGFITGFYDSREQGFIEGVRANNLPDDPELRVRMEPGFEGWIPPLGERGTEILMGLNHPPDAIVCASDRLAIGAIQWLHQHGIRVPQDIAVTGFDNIDGSAFTVPPLTTVHVHKQLMGELAAERVVRRIEDPDEVPLQIWTPTSLIVRQSCGNDL